MLFLVVHKIGIEDRSVWRGGETEMGRKMNGFWRHGYRTLQEARTGLNNPRRLVGVWAYGKKEIRPNPGLWGDGADEAGGPSDSLSLFSGGRRHRPSSQATNPAVSKRGRATCTLVLASAVCLSEPATKAREFLQSLWGMENSVAHGRCSDRIVGARCWMADWLAPDMRSCDV